MQALSISQPLQAAICLFVSASIFSSQGLECKDPWCSLGPPWLSRVDLTAPSGYVDIAGRGDLCKWINLSLLIFFLTFQSFAGEIKVLPANALYNRDLFWPGFLVKDKVSPDFPWRRDAVKNGSLIDALCALEEWGRGGTWPAFPSPAQGVLCKMTISLFAGHGSGGVSRSSSLPNPGCQTGGELTGCNWRIAFRHYFKTCPPLSQRMESLPKL